MQYVYTTGYLYILYVYGISHLYIKYVYKLAMPKPPIQLNLICLYYFIKMDFSAGDNYDCRGVSMSDASAYFFKIFKLKWKFIVFHNSNFKWKMFKILTKITKLDSTDFIITLFHSDIICVFFLFNIKYLNN